jgi:hypothetical protein
MIKKHLIVLALLFLSTPAICQIPRVEISQPAILEIIDLYLDSLQISQNENGAVLIELKFMRSVFENDTILGPDPYSRMDLVSESPDKSEDLSFELRIKLKSAIPVLRYAPPDFYSIYRNRPVLFYTGFHFINKPSKKAINDFMNKIMVYYARRQRIVTRPLWRFLVDDNKLRRI